MALGTVNVTPENGSGSDISEEIQALQVKTNEIAYTVSQNSRSIDHARLQAVTVSLTNTLSYPFNDSITTVALPRAVDTTNYSVAVETVSSDGCVGDYTVSEKLKNGFKLAYGGSAKSVSAICYIQEV